MGKDRVFESKQEITKEADALRSTETSNEELPKKTTGTEHDYKKRYDDLKSHYDTKLSTWRKEKEEILTQLQTNKKSNVVMPKTPEEIEKFKQDNPDVYDVIETIASMKTDSRVQDVEEHLNILREKEFELERQNAQRELLNHHSDFLELKDSEEFTKQLYSKYAVKVMPGQYLAYGKKNNPGKQYVRIALVHQENKNNKGLEKISKLLL